MVNKYLYLVVILVLSFPVVSEELLRASTSWDGGSLSYPKGEPEISSIILRLEAGGVSPFHCHPVPTFGFIKSGEIEVETLSGKTERFSEGDYVVEVMKTVHRGKALNGPVEIIVFYAGAKGVPTTVLHEGEGSATHCSPG